MKRLLDMDSDSDSTPANTLKFCRLGKCEVCDYKDARYSCPKCEVKTCSLPCLQIHKKELECDGIRNKTKFVPLNEMTEMDFVSDYTFLEECTRYVQARKRDKIKRFTRYNKSLPINLFALRNAASIRGTTLRFLLPNLTRRSINTTNYDKVSKVIYWRIEWIFTNAGNLKYVDPKCSEDETISHLLDKYLNPENFEDVPRKKDLEFYQSKGVGNLKILLKAEGVKRCKDRFYLLECSKTLKESLAGKIIVEFPTIHVCYEDAFMEFNVVESDEDVETETKEYKKSLNDLHKEMVNKLIKEEKSEETEEDVQKELDKLLIEKKREERHKRRKELEEDPGNLLFMDERLWDLISSSSESGNETEEEPTGPSSSFRK